MAEKKSTVKMGVLNEEKTASAGEEALKKAKKDEAKMKTAGDDSKPGIIISTNDHSDFVVYGDQTLRIAPRSRESVDDISLLPKQLPPGIIVKEVKSK